MSLAGAIPLCEVLIKIEKLASKIKAVPQDWDRYFSALQSLDHVQKVVKDVAKDIPFGSTMVINDEGEQLIPHCESNVSKVVSDAQALLKRFQEPNNAAIRKVKRFFARMGRRCQFIINEEEIAKLIETVEIAKTSLLLAISVAVLYKTNSGHEETKILIEDMKKEIKSQTKSLDDVRVALHEAQSQLPRLFVPDHIRGPSSSQPSRRPLLRSFGRSLTAGRQSLDAKAIEPTHASRNDSQMLLHDTQYNESSTVSRGRQSTPVLDERQRTDDISQPDWKDDVNNTTEVDPVCRSMSKHMEDADESKDLADMPELEILFADGQLITICASGRLGDPYVADRRAMPLNAELLVTHTAESTDDTHSEAGFQSDAQCLIDFLDTHTVSDTDFGSGTSEGLPDQVLNIQSQSEVFIPWWKYIETPEMYAEAAAKLMFCIECLSDDEDGQVLILIPPCPSPHCEHATLQGRGVPQFDDTRPGRFPLYLERMLEQRFMVPLPENGHMSAIFDVCSGDCGHTRVDISGTPMVKCMHATRFFGSFEQDIPNTTGPGPGPDTDSDSETMQAGRSEAAYRDGEDGIANNSTSPYQSVPCRHCAAYALRPTPEDRFFVGLPFCLLGALSYRCDRCQGKSWIPSSEWIWS